MNETSVVTAKSLVTSNIAESINSAKHLFDNYANSYLNNLKNAFAEKQKGVVEQEERNRTLTNNVIEINKILQIIDNEMRCN